MLSVKLSSRLGVAVDGNAPQALYITKAEYVLVNWWCYIQTQIYRLYRKMAIYGHFFL